MQELKHLVTSLSLSQSRAERSEFMDAAVYGLSSVSGRSPREQWAGFLSGLRISTIIHRRVGRHLDTG